jgi:Coenzyme PQQ synthesis protein D (PqqD)
MRASKPERNSSVKFFQKKDSAYLVFKNESFDLNPVASDIYKLCDGSRNVETIAAEISQIYEVDLETSCLDCIDVIDQLVQLRLLHLNIPK